MGPTRNRLQVHHRIHSQRGSARGAGADPGRRGAQEDPRRLDQPAERSDRQPSTLPGPSIHHARERRGQDRGRLYRNVDKPPVEWEERDDRFRHQIDLGRGRWRAQSRACENLFRYFCIGHGVGEHARRAREMSHAHSGTERRLRRMVAIATSILLLLLALLDRQMIWLQLIQHDHRS